MEEVEVSIWDQIPYEGERCSVCGDRLYDLKSMAPYRGGFKAQWLCDCMAVTESYTDQTASVHVGTIEKPWYRRLNHLFRLKINRKVYC